MTSVAQNGAVCVNSVKVYGSVAASARSAGLDSPLRLWWLARALDDGSGVVGHVELMEAAGRYIQGTERNRRRLLKTCEEQSWLEEIKRHDETVYIVHSLERISEGLGVAKISQPALVEMRELRSIRIWRVACWDACLGGRDGRRGRPISRKVLERVTGVEERAQQRYERESKRVKAQRNIAVTSIPSVFIEGMREFEKRAAFPVADNTGWQLPNSYTVDIELAPKGMSRKVNKRLRNGLLHKDATDSGAERVFYYDDKSAQRAMRKEVHPKEVYSKKRKPSKTGAEVWQHVS